MTLEQGFLLQDRYCIFEILGQGGMGYVYRAVDENLGVEVAVKENLFTTEEYAHQFRREAVILAKLRHQNLPRVTNHFVIKGQGQYLIMDYIPGEDLREWMEREGTVPEREVVTIGTALCDALGYLHSQDPIVLHRDVKPGNVRITSNGEVYLVDFGLAKIIRGDGVTAIGAQAMTPGYSPPEQYGAARTDNRSDIYSLGATLYAALTGVIPEDGLAQTMDQTELTPVRERNLGVSRQTASAIEKALAIYPEDRFQNAAEFKNELFIAQTKGLTKRKSLFPSHERPKLEVSISDTSQDLDAGRISLGGIPVSSSTLSTGDGEKDDRSFPPKKRERGWTFVRLLGILILMGAAILFLLKPYLPAQILSLVALAKATPVDIPTSTLEIEVMPSLSVMTTLKPAATLTNTPTTIMTFTPTLTLSPTLTFTPTAIMTFTPTLTLSPTLTFTPTQTPAPTITPIGGGKAQIAFVSLRTNKAQIWLKDIQGAGLSMITHMEEGACQPSWSPDGEKLVFISPCEENAKHYWETHLYMINADGTGLEALPIFGRGEYSPAWSPDGKKIAFTVIQEDYYHQIYVLTLADGNIEKISDGDAWDFHPAWSADGERIVFISTRNGPYQIWVMFSDGAFPQRFSSSKNLENTHPVWSPDGTLILFTQLTSENIFVVKRATYTEGGLHEETIYQGYAPTKEGNYSSDGKWIVFESWPTTDTNHDIYLFAVEKRSLQRLTTDPAYDFDPVWRPSLP